MDVPSLLTTSAPECPTNPFPPAFLLYGFRLSKESHSRTFPSLCLHDQEGSRKQEEDGHTKWTMLVPLPSPTSTILYPSPSPFPSLFLSSSPLSLLSPPVLPLPPLSWASEVASSKWLCPNGSCKRKSEHATAKRKWNGWGLGRIEGGSDFSTFLPSFSFFLSPKERYHFSRVTSQLIMRRSVVEENNAGHKLLRFSGSRVTAHMGEHFWTFMVGGKA